MKVVFVLQPWDLAVADSGGSSSVSIVTYQIARRLAGAGHAVSIYAKLGPGQAPVESDQAGVEFRRFANRRSERVIRGLQLADRAPVLRRGRLPLFASSLYHHGFADRVARDIAREGADVVHIHNFSQFVPVVRRICPQVVIALHMHCEWLSQLGPRRIRPRLEKADIVFGCSDYISREVRKRFPEMAEKCHTVVNGIDKREYAGCGRDGPGRANRPRRIVYAGRVSPEKGVHVLIDAFCTVAAAFPDVRLEIIGSPGSAPFEFLVGLSGNRGVAGLASFYSPWLKRDHGRYLRYLRDRIPPDLEDRVSFLGHLPHQALVEHYSEADVLVNPSLSEAFGMSLVEAMATGCPVVASRVGGMTDIVLDGGTGALVDPGDADQLSGEVIRLLADAELRESEGRAARQRVAELFDWDFIARRLVDEYLRAMSRRR